MKDRLYRKRVGELLWLSRVSRPDIFAAVARLSTVCNNPGLIHWDLTTYLIQYVHTTRDIGLLYEHGKTNYPYAFADVAFSPHYGDTDDDFRSFEGWLAKMAGCPIAWGARFQKLLALSSTEGKYFGLTTMAKTASHLTALCSDLYIESDEPFLIYEDNQAAMKMAKKSFDTRRMMHLDR